MTTPSIYKSPAGKQAVMALYETALAQWPVPYESRLIPTTHGDTFVMAWGDPSAPPLVLLHGAGANSAIWIGEAADYGNAFRVYAIDILGEAGKSAPNRPAWESPVYADWLAETLDTLGLERVALAGISLGGWTALKFAVSRPERVEKLVLITPAGITRDKLSFLVSAVFYTLLGRRGIPGMLRLIYSGHAIPPGAEEVTTLITQHFVSRIEMMPIFSDAELRRLTMPTMLVGGGRDRLRDNKKIAARLRGLLPQLEVRIVPAAGHGLLNTCGLTLPFLTAGMAVPV